MTGRIPKQMKAKPVHCVQKMTSGYSIGEVVERTGVPEGTLRVWERRHGFPAPRRLPGGHRRYSEQDLDLVQAVAAKRAAGLSLSAAIEQARSQLSRADDSVYARLRRRRPDLQPRTLLKPMMLALSRALEDEALARAEHSLLFGSFQRERFYRQARARWEELSRTAELAVVFADFKRPGRPRFGPTEVPVPRDHPLSREWALVCEGESFAACLAGWELPEAAAGPDGRRRFESIWSVEAEVVREAARACAAIAATGGLTMADGVSARLDEPLSPSLESQLRLSTDVSARMLSHISAWVIRSRR
jgi:DICT domain-containing protein